jgi:hypothetical protein
MGFKKDWNVVDIVSQINRMSYSCSSTMTDGFVGWGIKQDLLRIKWILDDALERCPTFVDEAEFIEKHEQDVTIKILKGN